MKNISPLTFATVATAIILIIVTTGDAMSRSFTKYQPHDLHVAAKGAAKDMMQPVVAVHVAVNPGYYRRPVLVMSQIKKAWPSSTHMKVQRINVSTLSVKFLIDGKADALPRRFKIIEAGKGH